MPILWGFSEFIRNFAEGSLRNGIRSVEYYFEFGGVLFLYRIAKIFKLYYSKINKE